MFSILAGLLYLAALLVPIYLLRRFGAMAWPWHVLAIAAAIGVGTAPPTPLLDHVAGTFIYGFAFLSLMVWGIGGLISRRSRRAKRMPANAG
jgi:hypothetical protein